MLLDIASSGGQLFDMTSVLETPNFEEAVPCNLSRPNIDIFAEEVATTLGFKPGGSLEDVVESLGGKIDYNSADTSRDGSLKVEGERSFTIYLPPHTSPLRDRFTIAHELGHFVLHSRYGERRIRIERHGSGQLEWEANWFAAGFLMPQKAFRTAHAETPSIGALAKKFNVSIEASRIRAESLGLK